MFNTSDKRTDMWHQDYNHNFDRKVWFKKVLREGDEVYVDRVLPYVQTKEEQEVNLPKLKLLWKSVGPFTVVQASSPTVMIKVEGIYYNLTIARYTKTPPALEIHPHPDPTEQNPSD